MPATGLLPSLAGRSRPLRLSSPPAVRGSYNPGMQASRFGLIPFRSPLLGKSRLLSLPPGTKMFQFSGSTVRRLCVQRPDAFP